MVCSTRRILGSAYHGGFFYSVCLIFGTICSASWFLVWKLSRQGKREKGRKLSVGREVCDQFVDSTSETFVNQDGYHGLSSGADFKVCDLNELTG